MNKIFYPSLIASLLMFSGLINGDQINADIVEKESIEETECNQATAIEKPGYIIEDWKTALFEQGTIKRNKQGFISVAKVKQQLKSKNMILVDIRNAEQFSSYRIPQSINIKAKQLSSKAFLKNKSVVLVNKGFSVAKMENLYKKLLAVGFNQISILDGGLNAWRQAGEKLEGAGQSITKLNRVTPQQFFLERKYKDLVVLDIAEPTSDYSETEIEQLLLQGLVDKSGHKTPQENRILITNDLGKGYEKIQLAVKTLAWHPVFFLQGGKKSYQTYLASQQAMWNRPTEKQGKVNTCGRRKR